MKIVIVDMNPNCQFSVGNNHPVFPVDEKLESRIKDYKPDCVFISMKHGIEIVKKAVNETKSAYFFGDFRRQPASYVSEFLSITNLGLFTFKHPNYWNMSKSPHVVRLGTNPDSFHRIPEVKKDFDVAFGGSFFIGNLRKEVLTFLHKNYKFLVIGNGWGPPLNSIPRKNHQKLNHHLNRAYVTVGSFNYTNLNDVGAKYGTSNRLYQNMAIGIPHVAPYCDGVPSYFDEGYISYKNLDELKIQIDRLLEMTQAERDLIGDIQQNQIRTKHTHAHAWANTERIIANNI